MDVNLAGKKAFVGGGSQGIGLAIAQGLALLGAEVTLLARNEETLQKATGSLSSTKGQKHDYLPLDFSQPDTVLSSVQAYLKQSPKANILINNTGGPPGGAIASASTEQFMAAFQAHLICNHLLAQALVPLMRDAGYGRIINIISTSVKIPLKGLGVSNTIRGAVASWSKTLANELAPFGITVNNILPGATSTGRLQSIIENKASKTGLTASAVQEEMLNEIPMGRFGRPEEIANAAIFLASPAASYITGINVPVDGGRTGSL